MDVTPAAPAAALWAGLHLALLLVLSVLTVRQRRQHAVPLGDGGVPQLARASRAFGNATEYVPSGLAALAILALAGAAPALIHLIGLTIFAGRVSHAFGLSRSEGATLPRAAGILLTWLGFIAAAVALLFYAIP